MRTTLAGIAGLAAYVALVGGLAASCESPWFRAFWIAAGVALVLSVPTQRRASSLPPPPDPRPR